MANKTGSSRLPNKDVEAQSDQRDIGLPRIVARTWGLISGISYMSNGGYLLMETEASGNCTGAGAFMVVMGLVVIFMECACCLCPGKNNCCDRVEKRFPFWARGLLYVVSVIPPLSLCFGVKTLITSIIVIMLGLLYIFLTCLVKSKKYERLQNEAMHRYREQQKSSAAVTYNAFTSTTETINSLKKNANMKMNQSRTKRPKKHNKHVKT